MAAKAFRFPGLTIVLALIVVVSLAPSPVFAARANSPAAVPVGPFLWNVEFFNNGTLTGAPVFTRQEYFVGGNWGLGSPGPGIPADLFSARWTTNAFLTGGTYRVTVVADDGVRFMVDGQTWLNTFDSPRPGETLVVDFAAGTGTHSVRMEFRENTSTAYLFFTWDQLTVTPTQPTPIPTPSGPPVGVVNTTGLNVHAGPGYNFALVDLAFQGWQMTLLGRNADSSWLQVRTPTGKIGWVEVSHISTSYPVAALQVVGSTTPGTPTKPPVGQPPTTPGQRTHVVQRGETLFRIALRYGVNMYTLASVNGITNLNLIYAGQVLIIP